MVRKVLALDGGGIRGAATAEFLRLLEQDLDGSLQDNFDMFVGTSTGGIIALAIAVLGLPGDELANLYNYENGNTIMDKSIWDRFVPPLNEPKYDGKGKRQVLESYFQQATLATAAKPAMVVTYDVQKRTSCVLKSEKHGHVLAVDAADATSAAPTYFPTVQVNDRWLVDGGVIANNPSMCAYAEARKKWSGADDEIRLLSVGTGSSTRLIDGAESRDYGIIEWFGHDFIGLVMDESVVEYQLRQILGSGDYLRVNSALSGVKVNDDMDDCRQGNIDALKELGASWYAQFGSDAVTLLS